MDEEGSLRTFFSSEALWGCLIGALCILPGSYRMDAAPQDRGRAAYRTLNDRLTPREYATLADWQQRASYLREHILASAGLLPFPDRTPLRPHVFDEQRRRDYSVFKVYFES